ncbi:hypothetical protein [Listeria fleischmannii]|uniref:Uncharacterized protein n=1 Tax=Listeria fleischmannii TaxID=1069827 RepID=A0A841YAR4_9LIST|nr:hypothetical protein [Listeria fleischmannii]MBC1397344.1 hypothetical protein [Listeria fleischmannii]MBC1419361.1 hypothetical protein [Listeria fleischmannii]MBC1425713.1 hypothetical protein [Listeria fleischmannii]
MKLLVLGGKCLLVLFLILSILYLASVPVAREFTEIKPLFSSTFIERIAFFTSFK